MSARRVSPTLLKIPVQSVARGDRANFYMHKPLLVLSSQGMPPLAFFRTSLREISINYPAST
jgi:hypothetical protein